MEACGVELLRIPTLSTYRLTDGGEIALMDRPFFTAREIFCIAPMLTALRAA
jgi:hypothetical protein